MARKIWYHRFYRQKRTCVQANFLCRMGPSRPWICIRNSCIKVNYKMICSHSIQLATTTVRVLYYMIWNKKLLIVFQDSVATFWRICAQDALRKIWKGKPSVRHKPIITKIFAVQRQFGMVDIQSMSDVQFKHFIKYQDHEIKILISTPIVARRKLCVAYALM